MQTPEQAKAAGEKLRQMLLQLAVTHNDIVGMLDSSKAQEKQAAHIKEMIEIVRMKIRPEYSQKKILLYEEGRTVRSLNFECERLWQKAIRLYLNSVRSSTFSIENYLEDPNQASILQELQSELRAQIETFTVPLLEKLETPGDDFLLYTYALMGDVDEKTAINNIASTGKTPPELDSAFFGMFGLLIEAERAKQQGDMGRAYSFLLDANHLIGMYESARYVMKHLPKVAKKRRAQLNSAKSREQVNKAKVRAYELFNAMRPTGTDGRPQYWKKASDAITKVWEALEKEAYEESGSDPDVTYSTVQSLCRELHKLDKDGGVVDIRVEVVQLFSDDTERKVPIG